MTACFGDNSVRAPPVDDLLNGSCGKSFGLGLRRGNCAVLADSFASVSFSAQLGTFQNMFLDLTRVQALLDLPSGSTFLSGATRVANDLYNSRALNPEAVQAVCPTTTLSFQQQVETLNILLCDLSGPCICLSIMYCLRIVAVMHMYGSL